MKAVIIKYFLALLFFTGFGFVISSCGIEIVSPGGNIFENFSYPYTTNSYWFYSYENYTSNYSNDSVRNYVNNDTLEGSGVSKWIGDTVINGITCRIFKSEHTGGIHTHHNTHEYFFNADSGLVELAHKITGNSFGPFAPHGAIHYRIGEKVFYSLPEIFSYAKTGFDNPGDTMVFLNPPANCIRYPVTPYSSEWHLTTNFYNIRKQYMQVENVTVPAGAFTCQGIRKIYYNPSGTPENNFVYIDYLSTIGIVKRKYTIKNIGAYTQTGELVGFFDANEEAELTTYHIE